MGLSRSKLKLFYKAVFLPAVISNILSIDLKIAEIVLKKSFAPSTASLIPDSTNAALASLRGLVMTALQSIQQPSKTQINKTVVEVFTKRWESIWALDTESSVTHLFLPSVTSACVMDLFPPSADIPQLLSDHCNLRRFLYFLKKIDSPKCLCGDAEETVVHFLFHCPRYAFHRLPLIKLVEEELSTWPPPPCLIISNKTLWLAVQKFVKVSKRFALPSN